MVLSSAIVCDYDRRIAEVCFHMIADDRRPYCDLRSAIRDHMETSLYVLSSAIVCDRDRRIADDRRSMFPYDRIRSQTIADLIAICDPRSYGNQPGAGGARAGGAPLIRDFGIPMYAKNFGYDVTVRPAYIRPSLRPSM